MFFHLFLPFLPLTTLLGQGAQGVARCLHHPLAGIGRNAIGFDAGTAVGQQVRLVEVDNELWDGHDLEGMLPGKRQSPLLIEVSRTASCFSIE